MRKASHDGADSSSITSGMDNETKKPTTNFSKMKKSSIKRKVQHLSHESDDGIIEPLLQTDKEKSEIANRSAKFLLNKSKTESLHEKDNKATDGYAETCSVSVPISSTSNIITNNVKQSPITTSYVCGSAPIHNHMNTNIFSAYDSTTGMTTTKSPILVEIDNTKSGIYSPSPLIFTTAKIHTDSKTKLMEPVQVTPVPILSTVEGNIIKAGIVNNTETTRTSGSTMTPTDHMKVLSGKYDANNVSQPYTISDPFSTVSHPNTTVKTESQSLESSANLLYKDEKCQFLNTVSKPKLGSNDFQALKEQPTKDVVSNIHKNISVSDIVIQPIELSKSAASTSEKYNLLDKEKQSFRNLNNKDNKILQAPIDSQNQINTHNINFKSSNNQKSISKEHVNSSDLSNKKLQRQTKILSEATNDAMSKNMKTQNTQNIIENKEKNISEKSDKEVTSKVDSKNPIATKNSSKIISSIAQTPKGTLSTILSAEIKAIPSSASASTSKEKSFTESINSKPTLIGGIKDVSKPLVSVASTAQSDVRDSKGSTIISTNAAVSPLTSTKVTTTSVCGKPNVVPSLYSSSQSITTEPPNSLPSYIVSTSKTKIGSTLTCNTSAIASKSQMQKPLVNVSTASAQVKSFETPIEKSAPSTSVVNGTKNTKFSKQTKSHAETIKKDGRA